VGRSPRGLADTPLRWRSIWRDVDDIPAGEPWPTEIRKALAAADAVLVLIGPDWLHNPRLTERRDVLRHEIQTALRSKASVVPLLVRCKNSAQDGLRKLGVSTSSRRLVLREPRPALRAYDTPVPRHNRIDTISPLNFIQSASSELTLPLR
jgi:hypothetical protein